MTHKFISVFSDPIDGCLIITVKRPKKEHLNNLLNTFDEYLLEIGPKYKVECFYLSPLSKKSDRYDFKTNLAFEVFMKNQ